MYTNYARLSWLWITAVLLLIGSSNYVHANPHQRLRGRFMVEFNHLASDANAHRDSKVLLEYLQEKFPDVDLSTPRILDYKLMRAATLQMDATKDDLHDSIIQAAVDTGLVTDVHPLYSTINPVKSGVVTTTSAAVASNKVLHDPPEIENANLLMAHGLTQVDRIHAEYNNTGDGIFIAVLDDGVDYMHPALGGGFGPGYKIRYGGDFVGVPVLELNADGSSNSKYDEDPMDDCHKYGYQAGHGTHVTGIIGAISDNYTGVAPDATLGVWRVMDCNGQGSDEIVIDGMFAAHEAGANIISMSLSNPRSWPERIISVAAERLSSAGVIVIAAAGNEGSQGAFTIGSPSVGKGVISVASFNNGYTLQDTILVNDIKDPIDVSVNSTLGLLPSADLVLGDKQSGNGSDACERTNIPKNVKGKLAIVQRGNCKFDIKVQNLAHSGAIGVLIYNNGFGDARVLPEMTNATIPVVGLSASNGTAIVKAIEEDKSGNKHVTISARVVPIAAHGAVSSFSSTGPSYENDFRPNIAGVGGMVYSTYPRALGSWFVQSGTSMAAPYVSGAFALYLKALKDTKQEQTPAYMLEQFQNYAHKASVANDSVLDSAYRQGAGLVQVYDAIYQTSHISPGSISFNDTANLNKTQTLTITNHGDSIAWYEIFNQVSITIDPYNQTGETSAYGFNAPVKYINGSTAHLRFSRKTIKVSPGSSTEVKITVTPPDIDPKLHIMYSGFIEFKSKLPNKNKDMTVPYIGIVGNQRELPIFDKEITRIEDSEYYYDLDELITFNPKNESTTPVVVLGLTTPSKLIVFRLYEHNTKKELGYALKPYKYANRSTGAKPIVGAFVWDGSYYEKLPPSEEERTLPDPAKHKVKPGKYQIVAQALKLLGDPNNKRDWEDWTSNVIEVV